LGEKKPSKLKKAKKSS